MNDYDSLWAHGRNWANCCVHLARKSCDFPGQVRVLEGMQQLCDQGSVWQTTSLQAMREISRSDCKIWRMSFCTDLEN